MFVAGRFSVEVLDNYGNIVIRGLGGVYAAGRNSISINTSKLLPGVYRVRVATPSIKQGINSLYFK
jgi:hypothetical protein